VHWTPTFRASNIVRMRQVFILAATLTVALTLVTAAGAKYTSRGSVSASERDLYTYRSPGRIVELVGNATTVAALVDSKRLGCLVVRWRPGHRAELKSAKLYADEAPSARNRRERCGGRDSPQSAPYYGLRFRGDAISWSWFECGNDCYQFDATWKGAHVRWLGAGGTESGDIGSHDEVQVPRHPKLRRSLNLAHGRVLLNSTTNTLVYIKR
jgi:hypothetical protein